MPSRSSFGGGLALRAALVAQPFFFGAGAILSRYVTDATTPGSLIRPLVVISIAAAVSFMAFRVATRSLPWSAVLASAFVLLSLREPLAGSIVFAIGMWWPLMRISRSLRGLPPPPERSLAGIARGSALFSVAFLVVMAWNAWGIATSAPSAAAPDFRTDGVGGPNIYVILLDGYPNPDTLQQTFGIDNSGFVDSVEKLGFDVSREARANYNKTWLTLASALNGGYVRELLEGQAIPEDSSSQTRWLHSLIANGAVIEGLRARGYEIRTVPSPFASASLTTADEYADPGIVTEFEARLLRQSPWSLVLGDWMRGLLVDSQREQVFSALESPARWAEQRTEAPQFVFAHVQSPHTPFVLDSDSSGDHRGPACFPMECSFWSSTIQELGITSDQYREELAAQLDGLNPRILETVTRIVEADSDAVVVLMSDHGSRYSLDDIPEHFRTFFAARTPGAAGLFSYDESPVNVFRNLFREYFGSDLKPLAYEAWLSPWGTRYLELEPYGE